MLVGCTQLVEQIEGLINHPLNTRAGAIYLVHHHNRLQTQGQRLAGYKAGLGHWAFNRIHKQQHRIHHRQHTLNLTTEVGVSWGVNDVDVGTFVFNRAVLGQNRDATFFFNVIAVHHAFFELFILAEGAGLAKKLVYQRGFAVVHVGDNCNVT